MTGNDENISTDTESLNHKKTKLMVFNEAKTKDFMPSFVMNGNELDVVEETKLLGVVITSDMKWSSNTEYIVSRANRKLWCLRRLKNRGAETVDLNLYISQTIA